MKRLHSVSFDLPGARKPRARKGFRVGMMIPCILLASLAIPVGRVHAQSIGKILGRWEMGMGYEIVKIEEHPTFNDQAVPGRIHRETARAFTSGFMWNIPVYPLAENLALGVSPAINLVLGPPVAAPDPTGVAGSSGSFNDDPQGFSIAVVNMPLLAMLNYGTDATMKRKNKSFGAGVGLGYQEGWLFTTSYFYGMPIAAAEVEYYNHIVMKLRGTMALAPYHLNDITVAHYNVSLFLTF